MSIKYDDLVTLERNIDAIVNAVDARLTSKIEKSN